MKRLFSAIAVILFFVPSLWAHGDEIHVVGTVAKIDGTTVTVKLADGSSKSVMVDSDTKFLRQSTAVKATDLKVGDRVVIHAKSVDGMLHASEVKIGEASKNTGSQPAPTHGRLGFLHDAVA